MFPLIPTLALAFVSFFSSAFVILRILIPILPPHPLSRRVRPSEFGLPNYRSISPADKSHLWLATCDLLALAVFTWQAVNEYLGGPAGYAIAGDPGSAVRLWFAMSLRQTCLLVISGLTLLHVRMGRSVAFGSKHWMLWAPTFLLVATSTAIAGVLAATNVRSFFVGLVAYSTTTAVLSTAAFGCLVGTLVIIKKNLAALDDIRDPWPPAKELPVEERRRPSFATEEINALKDGSSWITSRASSRCDSVSAFSFSTHHTHVRTHSRANSAASARMLPHPATASMPSIPAKSSFWFNPATPFVSHESIPPVPPLPAPYRPRSTTSAQINDDPDPFKRPAPRMGSQSSWLTEPSQYGPSLSNWSFPTTHVPSPPPTTASLPGLGTDLLPSTAVSRPMTPAMASAEVLGGYGWNPEAAQAEKGLNSFSSSSSSSDLDMSIFRTGGWLLMIWLPQGLGLPFLFMVSPGSPISSIGSILLILSVTLSAPLLALNLLFRSPIPIPSELFESYSEPPSAVLRAPSPASTTPSYLKYSHEYKRSGSVTVVESRRSTDVWVTNGDAVDNKGRVGRALGLLQPKPKLAVLPPEGEKLQNEEPLTPPLPMQMQPERSLPPTPAQSERSAEFGRTPGRPRKESKASSYYSGQSENLAFQTQILIAQRHYSALAQTIAVPPSPTAPTPLDRRASMDDAVAVTGVETTPARSRHSQHLRVRSVSSITGNTSVDSRFPVSPPPASPLPPTPPSVRERKARMLSHRKSHSHSSSSAGFSFGPIAGDDIAEIDALSAKVLPLLVPGLSIGSDIRVREEWGSWMSTSPRDVRAPTGTMKSSKTVPVELGGYSTDFSSPNGHSTPAEQKAKTMATRQRKVSHGRHHFSLPSLSLSKDGIHALATWRNDLNRALESKLGQYSQAPMTTDSTNNRRNTVYGYAGELVPNNHSHLDIVSEDAELLRPASPMSPAGPISNANRPVSAQTFGHDALPLPSRAQTSRASSRQSRNSLATLISALDQELRVPLPPPSAASEVTLFDLENFDPEADGPLASSTPHESQRTKPKSKNRDVPPVPQLRDGPKASRRSSIRYIVSDENAPVTAESPKVETSRGLAQWGARAIRPLVPKSPKSKSKKNERKIASPPAGGLRPLSLLQDRDVNQVRSETKPLSVGKRSKGSDENADPMGSLGKIKASLKPLKLNRSETTKERALLRQKEVLPDVVVRPPSEVDPGVLRHGW
ncbi:hypothetical protein BD309DRAFT_1016512 [Dichomitus squalens]|uniref:Uncharacterized protein n=1 Tax=Dichomitus squalens TaxID=114155 RepID=A0A4Q9Q980_9APHY|nr:hypothetical protein BD309DRAFT_1016512 [Dichomitus squalens]TBU63174.1 hypothetical protein BD310DRAFT_945200 [Dichomitus squalens]